MLSSTLSQLFQMDAFSIKFSCFHLFKSLTVDSILSSTGLANDPMIQSLNKLVDEFLRDTSKASEERWISGEGFQLYSQPGWEQWSVQRSFWGSGMCF